MKRHILLLAALVCTLIAAKAQLSIPPTELRYEVHYHWGLINLNIASGTVTMQTDGPEFSATLDGNSIPWEGRVFCISDTLRCTMTPTAGLSRETVTYANGWYMKPKVSQYRSNGFNPDDPANYKNIKGQGTLSADANTMEAVTVTDDMLAMFYYFREMDFESMAEGRTVTIPFTDEDGQAEKVVVTYNGKSHYNASGTAYPTYSVDFQYSYHGAMSGYTVHSEVSVSERIPVLISASLPIGHVEMIYAE